MNSKHLTLQKTLAITILLIGVIGIMLVIATDFTYRSVAYEQQTQSISQLIAIKSTDLIKKLTKRQKELGFRLQNESGFKEAFTAKNKKDIIYWLDQEFNRYYVTIGLIKLEKILIYDNEFQLLTKSDRGLDITNQNYPPCIQVIKKVGGMPNVQRTRPISQLCEYNNRPLLTTVLSIGSIKPEGYIQIITNPAHILTQIEAELGIPLKIYNKNNELLHQSINWPYNTETQEHLISSYTILDENEA
ncbi:MAG: hypothetical protein KAT12_03715, partial [Gammaproteobacteria bacterium]|nr:hypothetical protein [Gammaproteobacteria bacterium]